MKQKLPRGIGTVGLVFVLFFSTSGGPYTTETLIHSVGPGLGLLILALVPLVWSVPEALIVGELASMLPEEGGYYRWVDRAFGRFWAFQNGWLTWLYSLVDMAIYPVLFNHYFRYFIPASYPRALAIALPFVTLGYFVPLLTTLRASDWTTWSEGSWPQIAASSAGNAGRWIAIWIGLGGMVSALALFNALLLGYSRIPFVLAADGLLPKALSKLDVH